MAGAACLGRKWICLKLLRWICCYSVILVSVAQGEEYITAASLPPALPPSPCTLCILMIIRNEEANLRLNLPLWRDVADCFVFGVDDRTDDDSIGAIHASLPSWMPRTVYKYTFDGFAGARNLALDAAWQNYRNTTHLLMADPDWKPDLSTIDKTELDTDHQSFEFSIWDRSGQSMRLALWLQKHIKGLRFRYRLHEDLVPPPGPNGFFPGKRTKWEVAEVEGALSWHTNIHGHSRGLHRFDMDMELLRRDYADMPEDLHTLFYLGITMLARLETQIGKGTHARTPEIAATIDEAMGYLMKAVELHDVPEEEYVPTDEGGAPAVRQVNEFLWSSIRWIAHDHHYFTGNRSEAKKWYRKCIAYDTGRPDCQVFLSRLYLEGGELKQAWHHAQVPLLMIYPRRDLGHFYTYDCFLPIQAAKVIRARLTADELWGDNPKHMLILAVTLVEHHYTHCRLGPIVDDADDIANLKLELDALAAARGWDIPVERARLLSGEDISSYENITPTTTGVPLLSGMSSVVKLLLQKWGSSEVPANKFQAGIDESATAPVKKHLPDGQTLIYQTDDASPDVRPMCKHMLPRLRKLYAGESPAQAGGSGSAILSAANIQPIIRDHLSVATWDATQLPNAKHVGDWYADGSRNWTKLFRAVITGSTAAGSWHDLFELFSAHHQLSRLGRLVEVTFLGPDLAPMGRAQRMMEQCAWDAAGDAPHKTNPQPALAFARDTMEGLSRTYLEDPLDYLDIGGFLSISELENKEQVLTAITDRMKYGGIVRLWVLAKGCPGLDRFFQVQSFMRQGSLAGRPPQEVTDDMVAAFKETVRVDLSAGAGNEAQLVHALSPASPRYTVAGLSQALFAMGLTMVAVDGEEDLEAVLSNAGGVFVAMADKLNRWERLDLALSLMPHPAPVHTVFAVRHPPGYRQPQLHQQPQAPHAGLRNEL
eukprot:TRINITY_DN829_c0_g2_i1.p1 TRINITY_DN829_c0_g2~~TRINITY_DN829_c0_g2_i1.p1  ORF type:complete len:977 (+),score=264.58 TRINITY_DN829_c0_g2_i1:124-2931(+)